MTHNNRGQLAVDLNGAWRLYSNRLPPGSRALGTVVSNGETGALVYIEATGIYVRINAGALVTLPQRKVMAAIDQARTGSGGAGRGQGARSADGVTNVARYNVTLDAETEALARLAGDGDRSLGIRMALRAWEQGRSTS